jgi:hypothetical protein
MSDRGRRTINPANETTTTRPALIEIGISPRLLTRERVGHQAATLPIKTPDGSTTPQHDGRVDEPKIATRVVIVGPLTFLSEFRDEQRGDAPPIPTRSLD